MEEMKTIGHGVADGEGTGLGDGLSGGSGVGLGEGVGVAVTTAATEDEGCGEPSPPPEQLTIKKTNELMRIPSFVMLIFLAD